MAETSSFFPSPLVPASSLPARHRNFHWTFPLASARSPRGLAIVRFDRGFLTNPVLGDLAGRPITVRIAQKPASNTSVVDQRFIVFATACVHGKEIAVTEIGRLPDTKENEVEVARIVASLPQSHLSDRLAAAVIVVHRTVRKIERATEIPRTVSEHDPYWMRAEIKVIEVLKGDGATPGTGKPGTVVLLFPGSGDIAFRNERRSADDCCTDEEDDHKES